MIDRDEIDTLSHEQDVTPANVQRDYIFGWLLAGLFGESRYKDILVLKGGNALRKGYFSATRFSGDLDFSCASALDPEDLLVELNRACTLIRARTNVEFDIDQNRIAQVAHVRRNKIEYKFKLYFHDFYNDPSQVLISVRVGATEFDRLYLQPQTRHLIHPYSDANDCSADIRVVKLEEALADKLKCLLQRRSSFDLYDLLHATLISRDIDVDRTEMMRTFLRKTIFEPSPRVAKSLLLSVPFDLMRRYWEEKIACPLTSRLPFDNAVESFRTLLNDLFVNFSYGQGAEPLFFSAAHRNLIMEAGREQKLLKLNYHGVTRLVEPYSLSFKRRGDGLGQEYFYAWDQTGGRSSGPGIKTFLDYDIQDLQPTDEIFEPRFEIEVTKAGELHGDTSFAKHRAFAYGRQPRRGAATARFNIRCPYCGRAFPRQSRATTSLRPHQDNFGNRCHGRRGQFI